MQNHTTVKVGKTIKIIQSNHLTHAFDHVTQYIGIAEPLGISQFDWLYENLEEIASIFYKCCSWKYYPQLSILKDTPNKPKKKTINQTKQEQYPPTVPRTTQQTLHKHLPQEKIYFGIRV